MSRAVVKIEHAGPLTTVQDAGRPGYARFGVTAAGPMDRLAHAAANVAIGNRQDASAIETALGGLTLIVEEGTIAVAIAGARPSSPWMASRSNPGAPLRLAAMPASPSGPAAGAAGPIWRSPAPSPPSAGSAAPRPTRRAALAGAASRPATRW